MDNPIVGLAAWPRRALPSSLQALLALLLSACPRAPSAPPDAGQASAQTDAGRSQVEADSGRSGPKTGVGSKSVRLLTLKSQGEHCSVLERRPPDWAPKQIVELKHCENFLWSPDCRRALLRGPEPSLVDIPSGKRTVLPRPKEAFDHRDFAFGSDGRLYEFGEDEAHGKGILSVLEGGSFRKLESISLDTDRVPGWWLYAFEQNETMVGSSRSYQFALGPPLRAPSPEEAKLLASTPGDGTDWETRTDWVVASSGGVTVAYKGCPTECFGGACTPVVVLRKDQALKLPLAKGLPNECMPVQPAADYVLLERAAAVLLFDARTGALLLEVRGEQNAALAEP